MEGCLGSVAGRPPAAAILYYILYIICYILWAYHLALVNTFVIPYLQRLHFSGRKSIKEPNNSKLGLLPFLHCAAAPLRKPEGCNKTAPLRKPEGCSATLGSHKDALSKNGCGCMDVQHAWELIDLIGNSWDIDGICIEYRNFKQNLQIIRNN